MGGGGVPLIPGFQQKGEGRREKGEEGKMRIGMGVGVKEGVGCLGRGERVGKWVGGRGVGGGGRRGGGWGRHGVGVAVAGGSGGVRRGGGKGVGEWVGGGGGGVVGRGVKRGGEQGLDGV